MSTSGPNNLLIDVRSPAEFATGALSNDLHKAVNIEFTSISSLPLVYSTLHNTTVDPFSDNITLYCRSGRRSDIALQTLKEMGYVNVRDIGGFEEARAVLRREEVERSVEVMKLTEGKNKEADEGRKEERKKAFGALLEGLKGLEE